MALTAYCATTDVYRYATEMNINDNPLNSGATDITQYIKDGTIYCKMKLQGRYSLETVETLLTAGTLSAVVNYCAQVTARLLWEYLSVGEQGKPRVESVSRSIQAIETTIAFGSLMDDDNIPVPSINGPKLLHSPIPPDMELVYGIA